MKPLKYDPDRKWLVEVNEQQLYDIIDCVEDIHRFLAGDMGLSHTSSYIEDSTALLEFQRQMDKLQPFVTPGLFFGACYDWAGSGCPNKPQKGMIQRTYAIYRNLRHCIERFRQHESWNVYQSETLTCGVPLAICYPKDETEEPLFTLTAEEVETMKEAILYTKGAYDGKIALGLGGFRNLEDYKQSSIDMTNLLTRIKQWQQHNNTQL